MYYIYIYIYYILYTYILCIIYIYICIYIYIYIYIIYICEPMLLWMTLNMMTEANLISTLVSEILLLINHFLILRHAQSSPIKIPGSISRDVYP